MRGTRTGWRRRRTESRTCGQGRQPVSALIAAPLPLQPRVPAASLPGRASARQAANEVWLLVVQGLAQAPTKPKARVGTRTESLDTLILSLQKPPAEAGRRGGATAWDGRGRERQGWGLADRGGLREKARSRPVLVALATGLINSNSSSICALAGWVVWARGCLFSRKGKEAGGPGRLWSPGAGKGLTRPRFSRSVPTPRRKRQARPPETTTDFSGRSCSAQPKQRLSQTADSSACGVYTRAHTHAHTGEDTDSTVREAWVQMPAQLSESQFSYLQNWQHRSLQGLLGIVGGGPRAGAPEGSGLSWGKALLKVILAQEPPTQRPEGGTSKELDPGGRGNLGQQPLGSAKSRWVLGARVRVLDLSPRAAGASDVLGSSCWCQKGTE